jgi:hypothetical protein
MKLIGFNDTLETPLFITPWSLIHFLSGATLFFICRVFTKNLYIIFFVVFFLHSLYEFKDYYSTYINRIRFKEDSYISSFFKNNTLENTIGDTVVCILGFMVAYIIMKYTRYPNHALLQISSFTIIIFFIMFITIQND